MANYARSYGRHDFRLSSGEIVVVVSASDWGGYWKLLQGSAHSLQGVVLSPELITSQFAFCNIVSNKDIIKQRIERVAVFSRSTPDVVYALGTPVFDCDSVRPTNSLLFICNGRVIARKNKAYIHPDTQEAAVFRTDVYTGPNSLNARVASLVCSDLVNVAYLQPAVAGGMGCDFSISNRTQVVLMSACWSMPLIQGGRIMPSLLPDEQRYKTQLEGCVSRLFERYSGLTDLVIADRIFDGSEVVGPFNVHYHRA